MIMFVFKFVISIIILSSCLTHHSSRLHNLNYSFFIMSENIALSCVTILNINNLVHHTFFLHNMQMDVHFPG